jgi:hypothetical protein
MRTFKKISSTTRTSGLSWRFKYDDHHPVRNLNEELVLTDVFESLDLVPPATHPVKPSPPEEEMKPNQTLDRILCSLPLTCKESEPKMFCCTISCCSFW